MIIPLLPATNCDIASHIKFVSAIKSNLNQIKFFIVLALQYYAEACNEHSGPILASLHPGKAAPLEEMWQRWQAVRSTVSDLNGPRFEPQTSR